MAMKKYTIIILALLLSVVNAYAQRSEGTASASLAGRSLVGSIPRLTSSGKMEGTVVVAIKVDKYGNVTEATPGAEGTTMTNTNVWNAAKSAALRARFNSSANAPAFQEGTITYTFVTSGFVETDENALKFMGVPIDGPEEQFFDALVAKGFKKDYHDYATGMFNGEQVKVYLSTNHKIVDRVRVVYPYCSEDNNTRVKYNILLSRFNRNAKYVCIDPRFEVPADEEIYWVLNKNSKAYDAVYFYLHPEVNANDWVAEFKQEYEKRYRKPLHGLSYEEMEEALFCLPINVSASVSGVVWFTMVDVHSIEINYINFKNRPRGEDL